jgi:cytochrome c oxidase subunit 2
MDDDQQNEPNVLIAWILGIAVTIAIAVSLIVGIMAGVGGGSGVAGGTPIPAGASTAADSSAGAGASAAVTTGDGTAAPAEVEVAPALATGPGVPDLVRLYFDTAKFDLPADAASMLAAIADWAKADASATIGLSGFHDKRGDAAANAVLARNRAAATRDALIAAGVPAGRIVMVKPQETTGGDDDREARRVEIYPAQ